LKIVVCFKVAPDFEQVLPSDFENFSTDIDLNYVRRVIGCFDEAALELALKIKDGRAEKNLQTECVALTCADALQSTFARAIFAAGFDEVELITYSNSEFNSSNAAKNFNTKQIETAPKSFEFNSLNVAKNLADRIREISPDLILTGKQAGYADSGTVPFYLAELLGLSVFSDSVFCERFDGIVGNAIVCVGDMSVFGLRISPLKRLLAVSDKKIRVLRGVEYSIKDARISGFFRPKNNRQCKITSNISSEIEDILKDFE
jgi:electron transfer flavoprotein alpha/beta subunit